MTPIPLADQAVDDVEKGLARPARPEGLVLGNDAAWGGWGWCLARSVGPISVGHVALGSRRWRWDALGYQLDALEALVDKAAAPVRVVVEEAPAIYTSPAGGRRLARGHALTPYKLGQLTGSILLWGCREGWPYPWAVGVSEWRSWWNIRGRGRAIKKRSAIRLVLSKGWGRFLQPFSGEDQRGDVAEAILLAVGAAMRPELAPAGPARRRARATPGR